MSDSLQWAGLKQSHLFCWEVEVHSGAHSRAGSWLKADQSQWEISSGCEWPWIQINSSPCFKYALASLQTCRKETRWRNPEERNETGGVQQKLWESPVCFPILLAAFLFSSVLSFPLALQTSLVMLLGFKTFWNCNPSTFLPWRQL